MKKISLIFLSLFFIVIISVFVQAFYLEIGEDGFLEKIEPVLEVFNFIIAIVTLVLAIYMVPKLKDLGLTLRKSWTFLISTIIFFALFETLGLLDLLNIFKWHGLSDVLEFAFILSLLLAVFFMIKFFKDIAEVKEIAKQKK